MNKTLGLVLGAVLIAGAAFAGGYFFSASSPGAGARIVGRGGGFAQLSDAERQQLSTMSDSERQAFFKEKGIDMPAGGPGGQADGAGARVGGPGGGASLLEGVVAGVTDGKVTVTLSAGGSANAYVDESTVIASVSGTSATLEAGADVMVFAVPEAPGVNAAKAVVVK